LTGSPKPKDWPSALISSGWPQRPGRRFLGKNSAANTVDKPSSSGNNRSIESSEGSKQGGTTRPARHVSAGGESSGSVSTGGVGLLPSKPVNQSMPTNNSTISGTTSRGGIILSRRSFISSVTSFACVIRPTCNPCSPYHCNRSTGLSTSAEENRAPKPLTVDDCLNSRHRSSERPLLSVSRVKGSASRLTRLSRSIRTTGRWHAVVWTGCLCMVWATPRVPVRLAVYQGPLFAFGPCSV